MSGDKIVIENIKGISKLTAVFNFPESRIVVVTGKNGVGKTTLTKCLRLIEDPLIFDKAAGINSVRKESKVEFELTGWDPFSYAFNEKTESLDSKDALPKSGRVIAELPLPYGERFKHFSLVASHDSKLRDNIATEDYEDAVGLIGFLNSVYPGRKFDGLKVTKIGRHHFYFILKAQDYYIREDHLSSGEFFLIQLYRLATSGAALILVDEIDVALDASAQVKLYSALKPMLQQFGSRLIVVSHSLAFMGTVDDGGIYYLEEVEGKAFLEQRSFGYVKSDLYGFKGKERYIITEDETLAGFLEYLIKTKISPFFEYEVIQIGGEYQVRDIANKNDAIEIFAAPEHVLIIVDKDIFEKIGYRGKSKLHCSPVDDIEMFIWLNKDRLLPHINIPEFEQARRPKDTAKTYWKKLVRSRQISRDELYHRVERENPQGSEGLVEVLRKHICLG